MEKFQVLSHLMILWYVLNTKPSIIIIYTDRKKIAVVIRDKSLKVVFPFIIIVDQVSGNQNSEKKLH